MPWTNQKFPVSMKNLTEEVRQKAIEIANALLEENMEEEKAIPIAIAKAEEWAENRHKPIKEENSNPIQQKLTTNQPPQTQDNQPGQTDQMNPRPIHINPDYQGSQKLLDKMALISGGDSGIGKAVALHFAREGSNVAIIYLSEDKDAEETKSEIEQMGRHCMLIRGDMGDEKFCQSAVKEVFDMHGRIDILVNNAAEQHPQKDLKDIEASQL